MRELQSEAYVARGCAVHYDIVFGLTDRENPLANAVKEAWD